MNRAYMSAVLGVEQLVLPTLACSYVRDVIVYVGAPVAPSRVDWDRYLEFVAKHLCQRSIVYEQGGAPDALQRKRLHDVTAGIDSIVAVLTASVIGRGIVGMLSWIRPGYRAFSPDDLAGATMHLKVFGREADEVLAELAVLRRRMRP